MELFGNLSEMAFSTASGALVVGGVRDIYSIYIVVSGDRFECSME